MEKIKLVIPGYGYSKLIHIGIIVYACNFWLVQSARKRENQIIKKKGSTVFWNNKKKANQLIGLKG